MTNESLNKQVQNTYLPPAPPASKDSNIPPLLPPQELEILRNFPPADANKDGAKVIPLFHRKVYYNAIMNLNLTIKTNT